MDWPDSICFDRQAYVCKYCDKSCQMIPEDVEDGLQSLKTRVVRLLDQLTDLSMDHS